MPSVSNQPCNGKIDKTDIVRLSAFHKVADEMMNCGIFLVVFFIRKSLVIEKRIVFTDIFTVKSRLFQTNKKAFIFF